MASLRTLKDSSLASLRASQAVARGGKIQLGGRSAATCRRAFSGVSRRTPGTGTRAALLWTSVAGLAASVYWWQLSPIHNEVPAAQNEAKGSVVVQRIIVDDDDQHLNASVWGSNRCVAILPPLDSTSISLYKVKCHLASNARRGQYPQPQRCRMAERCRSPGYGSP